MKIISRILGILMILPLIEVLGVIGYIIPPIGIVLDIIGSVVLATFGCAMISDSI